MRSRPSFLQPQTPFCVRIIPNSSHKLEPQFPISNRITGRFNCIPHTFTCILLHPTHLHPLSTNKSSHSRVWTEWAGGEKTIKCWVLCKLQTIAKYELEMNQNEQNSIGRERTRTCALVSPSPCGIVRKGERELCTVSMMPLNALCPPPQHGIFFWWLTDASLLRVLAKVPRVLVKVLIVLVLVPAEVEAVVMVEQHAGIVLVRHLHQIAQKHEQYWTEDQHVGHLTIVPLNGNWKSVQWVSNIVECFHFKSWSACSIALPYRQTWGLLHSCVEQGERGWMNIWLLW